MEDQIEQGTPLFNGKRCRFPGSKAARGDAPNGGSLRLFFRCLYSQLAFVSSPPREFSLSSIPFQAFSIFLRRNSDHLDRNSDRLNFLNDRNESSSGDSSPVLFQFLFLSRLQCRFIGLLNMCHFSTQHFPQITNICGTILRP